MRKLIQVTMASVCFVILAAATSSSAIQYGADLVLLKDDGTWQVHVEGFQPGDEATVTLLCEGGTPIELGKATALDDGTIDEFYTLPGDIADVEKCAITVVGGAIDKTFQLTLPTAGSNTVGTVAVGGALVAVGGVIVAASSLGKRRAKAAA